MNSFTEGTFVVPNRTTRICVGELSAASPVPALQCDKWPTSCHKATSESVGYHSDPPYHKTYILGRVLRGIKHGRVQVHWLKKSDGDPDSEEICKSECLMGAEVG